MLALGHALGRGKTGSPRYNMVVVVLVLVVCLY